MFRRLQLYRWKPSRGRAYRVTSLDGSTLTYQLETCAKGIELLQLVLKDLGIPEGDYFGLFQSENKQWIILDKTLKKQLKGNGPYLLYMGVQVYPKDHNSILSPTTRYQIYLQAKQDLENRRLVCPSEIGDRLLNIIAAEARCMETVSNPILATAAENANSQCHLGNTKESSRDSCAREFLEVAQLEDGFGTFVYSDSSHRPFSLRLGPDGLCIVGGTRVEWDSVSKVSSFGRHLTICTMDTMQETQDPPTIVTFSSSSLCSSVVAHCARLKSAYSDLAYESTKTKLKRLLSLRLGRDATGKQSTQPVRLKKTTSFSIRFRSFRNRRTILAGHSMENMTAPTPPFDELTNHQPMQQTISQAPSECLSLSLTPPPSPTPSRHAVDVASSTGSCSQIAKSDNGYPTLAACDFVSTSAQPSELRADVSGHDIIAYSTPSEIGNLDSLLQTLEEKFKEHKSTIPLNPDQHASHAVSSVRKKRSISATDIHCVKAKHTNGYFKSHLSSVELNHFSPPTIMDPHVRSLVFDACENNALGTEL